MQIVVVGSGGREHALAHTFRSAGHEVVATPGNPGIPGSVGTAPEDLVTGTDLFVVGPETPLVDGLADRLRAAGAVVFGPGADGARLEGSKAWMKDLLVAAGVPTAAHRSFTAGEEAAAVAFLDELHAPYVIKTDGLAAGKGVLVTDDRSEAERATRDFLAGSAFGAAGTTCVIEEGLTGPELSVFAICDGTTAVLCGSAQDHKRVGDGDTGPNTGGMGAYSPVPSIDPAFEAEILDRAILPTLAELRRRGIDYRGFLYCGLMLDPSGWKVLEYNVRFGDPEAEVVLPRITSDLAVTLHEAAAGELRTPVVLDAGAAVTVVMASEGYPVGPRTGDAIAGIDDARALPGVLVFAAGVGTSGPEGAEADAGLTTGGGRVLAVTGTGPDVAAARALAYQAVGRISWPGEHHRSDIAAAFA